MVSFRKISDINIESFCEDIQTSPLFTTSDNMNVSELVNQYDKVMSSILDTHATIWSKMVTLHPPAPWYTDAIHQQKLVRRQLEQHWRVSKLLTDRELYVNQCSLVNKLIFNSKMSFYSNAVKDLKCDQKALFAAVDKMIQRKPPKLYPSSESRDKQLPWEIITTTHYQDRQSLLGKCYNAQWFKNGSPHTFTKEEFSWPWRI